MGSPFRVVFYSESNSTFKVFKNKHQAVSQGVRRFGKRSIFCYM
jgi:hypothetical protein